MARILNGNISGAVSNLVFYTMNGQGYVRVKPETRRKKKNSKELMQVSVFRRATVNGTSLLKQLQPYIRYKFKLKTYNKFRGWLIQVLKTADNRAGDEKLLPVAVYNFNPEADIRDIVLVQPDIQIMPGNRVQVQYPSFIPNQAIKAPAQTVEVSMNLVAVCNGFDNSRERSLLHSAAWSFAYNNLPTEEKQLELDIQNSNGKFVLIICTIDFCYRGYNTVARQNAEPMAAAVIGVGKG